ncbi:MAG: ABC-type transport auxiliary lipoprotein family protein [Luteimonas sp.]|nr:ABC-type transport auxiliary lipoprotein family protein [Luteimonas sp.]
MSKAARTRHPAVAGHESKITRRVRLAAIAAACVLLGGCSLLGGGTREQTTIYAPDPRISPDPSWPAVQWQLSVSPATAARMIDSLRIAVRPTPGELQVYKGASWAKTPTQMLEDAVLRGLEDSGRIGGVARQGSGIDGDYKLVMDLRRFEADYAGAAVPAATIEVNAKLLHPIDQQVVASRTFIGKQPAASTGVADVSASFDAALGDIARQIDGWVLVTGQQHDLQPH